MPLANKHIFLYLSAVPQHAVADNSATLTISGSQKKSHLLYPNGSCRKAVTCHLHAMTCNRYLNAIYHLMICPTQISFTPGKQLEKFMCQEFHQLHFGCFM